MGEMVNVDGRMLYLECTGSGSPTVVLQSGFGGPADVWSFSETQERAVQPALATTNRVCSYDRPGTPVLTTTRDGKVVPAERQRGRSDAVPMPRNPTAVVTELHDLLAAADVPGPYVMVGHSLGGTFSVLYACTYPDEVCALVLVDAPLPPLRGLVPTELVHRWLTPLVDMPGYELEFYDLNEVIDEIEAAKPLPAIPAVVVRRGAARFDVGSLPEDFPMTQAEIDATFDAGWEAQELWAKSVPGAELITVPGTTHDIHNQRPEIVVAKIRDAIARI